MKKYLPLQKNGFRVVLVCAFSIAIFCQSVIAQSSVPTERIKLPEGFKAELVYDVPNGQGSWVAITTDPQGRLITSDQYGGLYRVTVVGADAPKVEPINLKVGSAQGLLCAFDSLYVMENGKGLYRLRDTNDDDQYDSMELLQKINGGSEHGQHAIILSPDKKSIYICAGNHTALPELAASRVPRNWSEDQLLTRFPDAGGHANGKMAPGGWICKMDPDGKSIELVSSGYRNEYDIAFDPNGELFTYDADMEWDVGLPWYRPTRVCHAVSGSEWGWRFGSGKWPAYYPDTLPPVVDVGFGSPTGVVFGTGAKFPAAYQNRLFIADWSYGIIYSVQLTPSGASYSGTLERFCSAPALPVTDMTINPADGAMYFLIGGRRSQSALYRVTYAGSESTEKAAYPQLDPLVTLRRQLEELHLPGENANSAEKLDFAWQHLGHADRFIRYAARIAVEHQPVETWAERALSETDRQKTIEAIVALARCGNESHQAAAIEALQRVDWTASDLTKEQRLHLLRAYGLVLIRLGKPTPEAQAKIGELMAHFPNGNSDVDRELAKLLIAVKAPVTAKLVEMMIAPGPQEHQIAYAMMLTDVKTGWTIEDRKKYFQWFLDAAKIQGGRSLSGYVGNIRKAAVDGLSAEEKTELDSLLKQQPETRDPYADLKARPLVKKWTMEDLAALTTEDFSNRDLENGKKMFAVAACYKCHRISGSGGMVGPDLTPAGHRFNTHDLLETMIDPSKAVSDQYEATIFQLMDGRIVTGRVANLNNNVYNIQEDMASPGKFTDIKVSDIDEMKPSKVSMMPTGLLDNLTLDEIRDLVAYLKSTSPQ